MQTGLKLGHFERSYNDQLSSTGTLKSSLLKICLKSMAAKSCPHKGIKVWWKMAFRARDLRSYAGFDGFYSYTSARYHRIKEPSRQALALTYVNTASVRRHTPFNVPTSPATDKMFTKLNSASASDVKSPDLGFKVRRNTKL